MGELHAWHDGDWVRIGETTDRRAFCVQWKRTSATGPIVSETEDAEDNGPYLVTFLRDVVMGDYHPEVGDCMIMLKSPYSPGNNGLVTMHPGDWVYFDGNGQPVVIPDHIHQAIEGRLATTPMRKKASHEPGT
jgi:hypothetical protein